MTLWNACYNTYLVDLSAQYYTKSILKSYMQVSISYTFAMADITDADTDIETIRLINGDDSTYSGRLELLYNGTWGTVCDRLWSSSDAKVACRSVCHCTCSQNFNVRM